MADFKLLEYNGNNITTGLGKLNTLKKNFKDVLSNHNLMSNLESFILDLNKIKLNFITQMKVSYQDDEEFHFLIPVSSCDYFVNKIKDWILNEFPDAIDISDYFSESQEVDMGRLGNDAEENLRSNLVISTEISTMNIKRVFIGDDVYSTGTSIKVYKDKIQEQFNNKIEFSYGTLIKTQ